MLNKNNANQVSQAPQNNHQANQVSNQNINNSNHQSQFGLGLMAEQAQLLFLHQLANQ